MSEGKRSERLTIYFDGGCPLCRREIAHYQRLDQKHKLIRWVDIIQDNTELEKRGISLEEAMRRFHSVDATGQLLFGVDTFIALWRQLPYYKFLAPLMALPEIHGLLAWGYKHFAAWRFRYRCKNGCLVRPRSQ